MNGPAAERRRTASSSPATSASGSALPAAADSPPTRCSTSTGGTQVAASILLRGAEGFGARRHSRTDRSLTLSEDLPLIAVAVDSRPRIEALVEPTARITGTGLVTLERARL